MTKEPSVRRYEFPKHTTTLITSSSDIEIGDCETRHRACTSVPERRVVLVSSRSKKFPTWAAVRLCCATYALRFLWYFTYLKFLDSLEGRVEREAGVIRFPFSCWQKKGLRWSLNNLLFYLCVRLFSQKLHQEAASVQSTFDACVSKFSDRKADQKVKEKKENDILVFRCRKKPSLR